MREAGLGWADFLVIVALFGYWQIRADLGSATITTFYLMGLPSTAYPLHNWLPYDLTFSINSLLMILPSLCFFRAQPIMPKRDAEYYLWRRNKEKEKKEEKKRLDWEGKGYKHQKLEQGEEVRRSFVV